MVWMMGHYPDCNSGPPCLVDFGRKSAASPPMCFLKTRASTTRASKLAVDTGLTLENEAKKDRNEPHKSSKQENALIIL